MFKVDSVEDAMGLLLNFEYHEKQQLAILVTESRQIARNVRLFSREAIQVRVMSLHDTIKNNFICILIQSNPQYLDRGAVTAAVRGSERGSEKFF